MAATGALGEKNEGELDGHWKPESGDDQKQRSVPSHELIYEVFERMSAISHDLSDPTISVHSLSSARGRLSTALPPEKYIRRTNTPMKI